MGLFQTTLVLRRGECPYIHISVEHRKRFRNPTDDRSSYNYPRLVVSARIFITYLQFYEADFFTFSLNAIKRMDIRYLACSWNFHVSLHNNIRDTIFTYQYFWLGFGNLKLERVTSKYIYLFYLVVFFITIVCIGGARNLKSRKMCSQKFRSWQSKMLKHLVNSDCWLVVSDI